MSDTRPRWFNQVKAHAATLDAIERGVKRLCITSPTGSGKTTIYTDTIEWALNQGQTVALFTNRRLLYDQIANNLEHDGVGFGRIAAGHDKDLAKAVQLVMIQTELSRRKKGFGSPRFDLVLVDEYHQFGGDVFQDLLQGYVSDGATMVTYTASPLDLVGIDELHIAATTPELIRAGILVPAETFAPDEPDMRHIKRYQVGEEISEADNRKAIMRPGIFGRVVGAYRNNNPQQLPTILFGPDVAGSKFFAEQFTQSGIRAAHLDGEDVWLDGESKSSTREARAHVIELFRRGEVKVICNRFLMREGISIREIGCQILANAFGSLSAYIQAGGRGLRCCPEIGKTKCIVNDHGANWHRLGSLNEERLWTLESTNHRMVGERQERMREGKEPQPIVCPKCGKVRLSGRECPSCHFVAHKRSRMVVQIDGTLRPVDGDIYKPHRVRQLPNQEQLWIRMYHRMKRAGRTFRQAEALYCVENHGWPPRDLPFMPKEPGDWWRKIESVDRSALL